MKEQIFPINCRGFIDVTKPPYNCDPTGKIDCTKVICQLVDDLLQRQIDGINNMLKKLEEHDGDVVFGFENRKINGVISVIFPEFCDPTPTIYFPNGTYLVSDTISYSHKNLQNFYTQGRAKGMELNRHIRFLGQSRENTIIKLQDSCKGFEFGQNRAVFNFIRAERSNVAMSNYIENLTIDTGKDNPGAVGLIFYGNNNGAVRSVTIKSGDGQGAIGLGVLNEIVSGCYVRDALVDGFDTGIKVTPTRNFTVFEDIHLKNQNLCGFEVQHTITSIRNLKSENKVTGLWVNGASAHVVLTDGEFISPVKTDMCGIRIDLGCAFLRNINTKNYAKAYSRFLDEECAPDGFVEEYSTHGRFSLYPEDKDAKTLNLPVEKFPDARPVEDLSKWVCAENFGAKGDGKTDDTKAIQNALNSGYPVVWLQPGNYCISAPITIPATVKHFHCMYSDFVLSENMINAKGEGVFIVEGDSEDPLVIEKILAWEQCHGHVRFIKHATARTLYLKDILTQTCAIYFNTVPGGKVFFENVGCTSGNVEYRYLPCVELHGQTAWGHLLNPERATIEVLNDGGSFWLMGFKTEGDGPVVDTRNGGYTEILGGIMSIGRNKLTPIINSTDSNVSAILATNSYTQLANYPVAVTDTRKGSPRHLFAHDLPYRIFPFTFIPLYTGYAGEPEEKKKELYDLY